jgi:hypothetical protein
MDRRSWGCKNRIFRYEYTEIVARRQWGHGLVIAQAVAEKMGRPMFERLSSD